MASVPAITQSEALAFVDQFFRAEGAGETRTQEPMLTSDFTVVGPLGFILPHEGWTHSRTSGDFSYQSFSWSGATARVYGDTAIVIGVQDSKATYQGHDASGQFRGTVILISHQGTRKIAGMHFSSIDQPLRS